eukprot:745704-Amphidinium_carterae.2
MRTTSRPTPVRRWQKRTTSLHDSPAMRSSNSSKNMPRQQFEWGQLIVILGPSASTSAPHLTCTRLWQNTAIMNKHFDFVGNLFMYAKHGHQLNLRRRSWWLQSRRHFVNKVLNQTRSRLFVLGNTFGTTNFWRGKFGMGSWSKRQRGPKLGCLTLQPLQSAVGSTSGAPLHVGKLQKWQGHHPGVGGCMRNSQEMWPWRLATVFEEDARSKSNNVTLSKVGEHPLLSRHSTRGVPRPVRELQALNCACTTGSADRDGIVECQSADGTGSDASQRQA